VSAGDASLLRQQPLRRACVAVPAALVLAATAAPAVLAAGPAPDPSPARAGVAVAPDPFPAMRVPLARSAAAPAGSRPAAVRSEPFRPPAVIAAAAPTTHTAPRRTEHARPQRHTAPPARPQHTVARSRTVAPTRALRRPLPAVAAPLLSAPAAGGGDRVPRALAVALALVVLASGSFVAFAAREVAR
jgi:hypothetical protein